MVLFFVFINYGFYGNTYYKQIYKYDRKYARFVWALTARLGELVHFMFAFMLFVIIFATERNVCVYILIL